MLRPGSSLLSLSKGVRIATPRIFSRAALTCASPGNASGLEINHLSDARSARLLQHIVRRCQVLRRNSQRLVQRHVERRTASLLGTVRDFANLAENMLRRDRTLAQRAEILAAFIDGGVAAVDEE